MKSILDTIVEKRRRKIETLGAALQNDVPESRPSNFKLVPFISDSNAKDTFLIGEIKKRSPSRGSISPNLIALKQAEIYYSKRLRNFSVLTEEDHFSGSLHDLYKIKAAFPDCAILRKDFLLYEEDIHISYASGADAVLLIVSILEIGQLTKLFNLAKKLGLDVLVEIHDKNDFEKIVKAGICPRFIGINSRNLSTFRVDMLGAISLQNNCINKINQGAEGNWQPHFVFESGIFSAEQVSFVSQQGFSGILVGESVVRRPNLIPELQTALSASVESNSVAFWSAIRASLAKRLCTQRPLVKICGITRAQDAELAVELGADLLGFIFVESKRRASIQLLKELSELRVIKIAVVDAEPSPELRQCWKEGLISAFQYHGAENPQNCADRNLPYYKALEIRELNDTRKIMEYSCPRVLIDYPRRNIAEIKPIQRKQLDSSVILAAAKQKPLWLAGGIKHENVIEIIETFEPELIDISSGIEESIGVKDESKLHKLFENIAKCSCETSGH